MKRGLFFFVLAFLASLCLAQNPSVIFKGDALFNGDHGIAIWNGDDLRFSRGGAVADFDHCGNALSSDGSSQYAYHADTDELDVGTEDFMLSVILKSTDVVNGWRIFEKNFSNNGCYMFYYNPGANIRIYMKDASGTTVYGDILNTSVTDGYWHLVNVLVDRDGYAYGFLDGKYSSQIAVGTVTSSLSNTAAFNFGSGNGTKTYDDSRKFNFGKDGLWTNGGTGGVDLEIRVGDSSGDVLYSELSPYSPSNPGGLIPLMAKSPYASLSDLGFGSLEDADRTELHNGSGSVSGMVVGNWYFFDQGTAGHDLTVGSNTYTSDTVFVASATTGTISSGDANDSVKRMGEVAHWTMNSVSGTTIYDETSNNLDLTTVGSPSFPTNYLLSPKVYNTLNPHTGSLLRTIRPNWDGNDNQKHIIFEQYYDADNYIRAYKDTDNLLYFAYKGGGTEVKTTGYDISAWTAGTWYWLCFVYSKNSIDGTDYLQVYIDGSKVDNSTTELQPIEGVESQWDFGHDDAANQFDGVIANAVNLDIPIPATESDAETIGLSPQQSVEWLYNAGVGNNPVVDENTRFLFVK